MMGLAGMIKIAYHRRFFDVVTPVPDFQGRCRRDAIVKPAFIDATLSEIFKKYFVELVAI